MIQSISIRDARYCQFTSVVSPKTLANDITQGRERGCYNFKTRFQNEYPTPNVR